MSGSRVILLSKTFHLLLLLLTSSTTSTSAAPSYTGSLDLDGDMDAESNAFASMDESVVDRDVSPSSSSHLTIPPGSYSPAGTRPHVMTIKQLAPTPMDAMEELSSMIAEASGQMPMMMPMPLTTALQSTMQKSMKGLNDFMMQMSMSMPNVGQHQSSPCAAMGMNGGGGGGGGGSKGPDLMALLRQLTDSLNPMNFLNSILNMMKSTSMSMQSSMSNSGMMGGGCGGGD